jgi:hypothetical protein
MTANQRLALVFLLRSLRTYHFILQNEKLILFLFLCLLLTAVYPRRVRRFSPDVPETFQPIIWRVICQIFWLASILPLPEKHNNVNAKEQRA